VLLDPAIKDMEDARDALARWFDHGMDRASGWYKRRAHAIILGVALVSAVGCDVDAIRVGRALAQDTTLREAIVAVGQSTAKSPPPANDQTPLTRAAEINEELASLELPIGRWWTHGEKLRASSVLSSLVGWLITALAASLGAPFWFDILGKLVNLRSAGLPPKKTAPAQGDDGADNA
jgi:hypothetical protein